MKYITQYAIFFVVLMTISSCSSTSKEFISNSNKSGEEHWFHMYHAGGLTNVYRFSLIPLKKDNIKISIKKRYKLHDDFAKPVELVRLLNISGYKASLVKKSGLRWAWYPKKYLIPITYYQVDVLRPVDNQIYTLAKFINQKNLNKIKQCLVKYTENEGTLSSEKCLQKFVVP